MRRLGEAWFACQSNSREEERARYFLEDKGFEVFLPMMEAQRTVGLRTMVVKKPLFPSYLFVRFDGDADLPLVRWTKGVRRILPESLRPAVVDDQIVESLLALSQRDGVIRNQPLKRSDKVRILCGPFKELLGIFDEWASDRGRVRVLLRFIDYQARLELHHTLSERLA